MARSSAPGLLIAALVLVAGLLLAFTAGRFAVSLGDLLAVALHDEAAFVRRVTTALAARSSATLRALAADLECYSAFCFDSPRPGLPASAERLTGYVGHLEAKRRSPATISRKLASLGAVQPIPASVF